MRLDCSYYGKYNTYCISKPQGVTAYRMSHDPSPMPRDWTKLRSDLLEVAKEGNPEWMDDREIKSALNESSRHGLRPELLISCQAAVGGRQPVPARGNEPG